MRQSKNGLFLKTLQMCTDAVSALGKKRFNKDLVSVIFLPPI